MTAQASIGCATGEPDRQEAGTPSAGDTAARTAGNIAWIVFLVIINVVTLGYFVPWWVAVHRHVPNWGSVIVVNVLLGWTLVGWAVAMAMACRSIPDGAPAKDAVWQVSEGNQS
jgi:Superinfection immunity protein